VPSSEVLQQVRHGIAVPCGPQVTRLLEALLAPFPWFFF